MSFLPMSLQHLHAWEFDLMRATSAQQQHLQNVFKDRQTFKKRAQKKFGVESSSPGVTRASLSLSTGPD